MRSRGLLALGRMVALAAFVIAGSGGCRLPSPSRFDEVIWQDSTVTRQRPYPRLRMADDLVRRGVLDGLTADSVIRLLGPRPDTPYFKAWDFVYWLGPERSLMGLDSEWLVVALGPDGRVSRVEIVRD